MSRFGFIGTRLVQLIPVAIGVTIITFFLIRLIPGDTVTAILGQHYTPQLAAAMRKSMGLDKPIWTQYLVFMGNLAHGDPHMDLPPVLMALDATILVTGRSGERTLKVENLFAGYYETVLKPGELITELRVPAQGKRRAAYLKVTTGAADDWPALGVAVSFETNGRTLSDVRVVASAATEKAIRLKAAEEVLSSATVDDSVLARAGDAAADDTETVSDVRGSAPYKRELLRVYVRRAVRQALDGTGGASH